MATQKIRGHEQRISFRDLARFVWPRQTAFELSEATHSGERAAKRWLAGSRKPPGAAYRAVLGEIMRKLD